MNSHNEVQALLDGLAEQLQRQLSALAITAPQIVGIHTGGVWVAQALQQRLDIETPLGELDIAFYRDDFSRIGLHPRVRPSKLPFSVDDQSIVLVDDVIYSGRTIRAALNAIFDYGRPARVLLAVLVDRGGRELPVEPTVSGTRLDLPDDTRVKLQGPDPMELHIQRQDS